MNMIYLINQYPRPSHTFIKREIRQLENLGVTVSRVAIRRSADQLVDVTDEEERERTVYLLDSPVHLLWSVLFFLFTRPKNFVSAFSCAWKLYRQKHEMLPQHLFYFVEACSLARLARRRNASHIHAHFGTNPAAVALIASILGTIPYSFTIHGPDEFDQPLQLSLADKVKRAKFVAAISDYTKSQICRWTPHDHWKKIKVVRCGLDPEYFQIEPPKNSASTIFLSIGRLSAQKGQLLLLSAFKSVCEENSGAELWIVGDGELRSEMESEIERLGLTASVKLLGWKSAPEIRDLIIGARCLVMSSFAEGLPVVIMESMALKTPVITTNIAGIAELVRDGRNGWLVPPGAEADLTIAMQDCLNKTDAELSSMGREAYDLCRVKHDVSKNALTLRSLFS
ncbi:glycosyltransferase [Rhizobium sp. B230/85]|nr:glycosyltransferase [Rhizobium sp. B209b/85]QXZ99065.1 glycosyltransferase [Rhizobium sp. B230/85]